jgi:hypothetical protein
VFSFLVLYFELGCALLFKISKTRQENTPLSNKDQNYYKNNEDLTVYLVIITCLRKAPPYHSMTRITRTRRTSSLRYLLSCFDLFEQDFARTMHVVLRGSRVLARAGCALGECRDSRRMAGHRPPPWGSVGSRTHRQDKHTLYHCGNPRLATSS